MRNKISWWQFLWKVWIWRTVSPLNKVGTLLLLLLMLLMLLFGEVIDSLLHGEVIDSLLKPRRTEVE